MIAYALVLSFAISFGFAAVVVRHVRRKRMNERHALLWLGLSTLVMLLSLFPRLLDSVARLLNVTYAPSLLYMLAILGMLFLLLHMTLAVSKLTERSNRLAQLVAIQEEKLRRLYGETTDETGNRSRHE
ncbi:MAG: DUF2304 domain-containing protein [Paenibacillaceae bacterium]|nr:DUF2304 domain-containing protein [Paenibacillaceae bacterium]